MLLINRYFGGNLPFTGIIREVYGLPYATSTLYSSTVQNILFRYGLSHDLECLCRGAPRTRNYLKHGRLPLRIEDLQDAPHRQKIMSGGGTYDFSVLHHRWNHSAMQ